MISVVVSILILVIAALGVLVGVLRARKKPLSAAICRLGFTLIALGITIPVTALIAWAAAGGIVNAIRGALPIFDELLMNASSMAGFFRAICATGIASILFLILFPVINALLRIPVKPLARLLDEKVFNRGEKTADLQLETADLQPEPADLSENPVPSVNSEVNSAESEKKNPWRLVLGGLCGLVFAVAMLTPVIGMLRIVGDLASLPAALTEGADEAEIINSLAKSPDTLPAKAVWYIGGGPVYKCITTYNIGNVRLSVTKETALIRELADYLRDPAEDKGTFSSYSSAPGESALIGEVLPDTFEGMFDRWASGESYMGISAPAIGGMSGEILDGGLQKFSELSSAQLRDSMLAMTDLAAYLLDSDGIDNMDVIFSDEDRLTDVYACLISSEVLHEALKSALDAGLQTMMDKWSGSGIVLAGIMPEGADGIREEARALAHATVSLIHFNENFSLERENLSDTLRNLGEILDGFKDTDMIGKEQTKELMESALRSESVKEALGYDSARAEEAINDVLKDLDSESYADLLSSLADQLE